MSRVVFCALGALAGLLQATLAAVLRNGASVTPIEKVIVLLEDLKAEVETEGQNEATAYNEFSCFCKDSTATKSSSILSGNDRIGDLSAAIEANTALKTEKSSELAERVARDTELQNSLEAEVARCAKEAAVYAATSADLNKAISSILRAVNALEASKPVAAEADAAASSDRPAFLQELSQPIERSLALADAMGLIDSPKRQAITAFLQHQAAGSAHRRADPADPEYKYHSHGILETLDKLLADFRAEKSDLDTEYGKTKQACDESINALGQEISNNEAAMTSLEVEIDGLQSSIALDRESLVNAESVLKDDELYLKSLTSQCERRASDWDQRSQLRASELEAFTAALAILTNNVQNATEVNVRALFLENSRQNATTNTGTQLSALATSSSPKRSAEASEGVRVLSFLQAGGSLRSAAAAVDAASASARQEKAVLMLSQEGRRLKSSALTALAMRMTSRGPFDKVKELIQQLIQRLIAEATQEATKKGFCDTELAKAETERNFTLANAKRMNVELAGLEAKRDELDSEITSLTEALSTLNENLVNATDLRSTEKADNLETLRRAKEGLTALTEAVMILKVFYKQSAKAAVLTQRKASPVDEDTSGPGFAGSYAGKQEASTGIIGMLEVIKADFDRTIRFTEAAEKTSAADFVKFERTAKADIAGKETKKSLDEEDLTITRDKISEGMTSLKSEMDLLDLTLKRLETLRPTCIDTGMSWEERKAKREDEIQALKKANCILMPEDMAQSEASCAGLLSNS